MPVVLFTTALDGLQEAKNRKLLADDEYKVIYSILVDLPKEINHLIIWTEDHLSK